MSRKAQLVLICEDQDHESFARRFLNRAGWSTRRLRVERVPPPQGSAEQYVRKRFPVELTAYRSNRQRVTERLVVFIDGDNRGASHRLDELDQACRSSGIEPRAKDEKVAIFVPTWNIETWLAYLSGLEEVDESKGDYPRLKRPRDCQSHVDQLYDMCQGGALRHPAPPSLEAACAEYHSRLK